MSMAFSWEMRVESSGLESLVVIGILIKRLRGFLKGFPTRKVLGSLRVHVLARRNIGSGN